MGGNNWFTPKQRLQDYEQHGFCVEGLNSKKSCNGRDRKGCPYLKSKSKSKSKSKKGQTTFEDCPVCHNTGLRTDVWMVSIRDDCGGKLGQDDSVIENVEAKLKDLSITITNSDNRRRLSPGETFLHRLRRAKPHRDSPVLTRL